jgi:hypothetical protein
LRRRQKPRPYVEYGGMWFTNPYNGTEVFITWEQVEQTCQFAISDFEAGNPQYTGSGDLVKSWKDDPTYNLRSQRGKVRNPRR